MRTRAVVRLQELHGQIIHDECARIHSAEVLDTLGVRSF